MIYMLFIGVALLTMALYLKPQWLLVALATLSFGLYFNVLEQGNWMQYFLFLLGVILLVFEFYIPGFGIAGVLGLIATIGALFWQTNDPMIVLYLVTLSMITLLTVIFIFTKLKKPVLLGPAFILETKLNKPSGFSANPDLSHLKGQKGRTITDLRPVGRAQFGDDIFDVISDMDMISRETQIIVNRVEGSKIYVRKEKNNL